MASNPRDTPTRKKLDGKVAQRRGKHEKNRQNRIDSRLSAGSLGESIRKLGLDKPNKKRGSSGEYHS